MSVLTSLPVLAQEVREEEELPVSIAAGDGAKSANPATEALEAAKAAAHSHHPQDTGNAPGLTGAAK